MGTGQHRCHTANMTSGSILLGTSAVGGRAVAVSAGHVDEDEGGLLARGREVRIGRADTAMCKPFVGRLVVEGEKTGGLGRAWGSSGELL